MKISLGTAQFGFDYGITNKLGRVSLSQIEQILLQAKKRGVNSLDTAASYGASEESLGSIGLDDWNVVTKIPSPKPSGINVLTWVADSFDTSLTRLRLKSTYAVLLHNANDLLGGQKNAFYDAIAELKHRKLVTKIGVSVYRPEELEEILDNFDLDIIQLPLSIVDRRFQTKSLLQLLESKDIEVQSRSVFLQGLLLANKDNLPEKFKRFLPFWKCWWAWLEDAQLSPIEACLAYVENLKWLNKTIVGIESVNQLNQIINACGSRLNTFPDFSAYAHFELVNPSLWDEL
jgi:hypothetical protein